MNNRKAISIVSIIVIFLISILGIFNDKLNTISIQVNTYCITSNDENAIKENADESSGDSTENNIEISKDGKEDANDFKVTTLENSKNKLIDKLDIVKQYLEIKQSDKSTKDFVEWFTKQYSLKVVSELGLSGNNINRDFYIQTGKSLFVLCDEFLEDKEDIHKDAKKTDEVSLLFAGDICLAEDGFVLDYYDTTSGLKDCISEKIIEQCNEADIFMLNNEFSISDRGSAIPGKMYTFRAKPERVKILNELGADIVSLANNHVYDFGHEAFEDTIDIIRNAGITTVGGGRNSNEAEKVVYYVVNGIKIGFVSASRAEKVRYTPGAKEDSAGIFLMYDDTRLNEVIASADKQCDYLIAYIHWGTEDSKYFEAYQHEIAQKMIASGVDAIIGGHPHVLQGMEYIDGKPVVYSLGDFWFNGETKYNGMINLKIDISGLKSMTYIPCMQSNYKTLYLEDEQNKTDVLDYLRELSPDCTIDDDCIIMPKNTSE